MIQRLIANAPALVAVLDEKGRLVSLNSAWHTLLGWSLEELLGQHFSVFVHPDDLASTQVAIAEAMTAAGNVGRVGRLRHKDDSYRYFSWTAPGNAPPHGIAIGIDVTREHESRVAAERAQARLQSILSTVPGYVINADRDGTIEYVNRTRPGLALDEYIGSNVFDRVNPEHLDAIRHAVEMVFAGHQVRDLVCGATHSDGNLGWYRTAFGAIDRDGEIESVILYSEDVTQQIRAERARAQAARFEAIGRVTAAIVHDLNNILMAIGVASELLELRNTNAQDQDDIELLLSAVTQGRQLTEHLMVPFRSEIKDAEVIDLVAAVVSLEPLLLRTGKGLLAVEIHDPGRSFPVEMPSHTVSQLVLNLVVNAAEAMTSGGRVDIEFEERAVEEGSHEELAAGDYVTLVVQDDGPGISDAVREHVFDPFFTTKESGSGFGLATCYAIARRCGGRIFLSCPVSGGTRVEVTLPLSAPSPAIPAKGKRAPATAAAVSRGPVAGSVARLAEQAPVILLAEDAANTRVALARYLRREGYAVLEAADGHDALEVAARYGQPLDALLTDMVMPGIDGTSLIKELRATQPNLAVLAMSGYALPQQLEELAAQGVSLMRKPVLPSEILARVRELLSS